MLALHRRVHQRFVSFACFASVTNYKFCRTCSPYVCVHIIGSVGQRESFEKRGSCKCVRQLRMRLPECVSEFTDSHRTQIVEGRSQLYTNSDDNCDSQIANRTATCKKKTHVQVCSRAQCVEMRCARSIVKGEKILIGNFYSIHANVSSSSSSLSTLPLTCCWYNHCVLIDINIYACW